MKKNQHYWLVGANWDGNDQADAFFRRGYWELGWDDLEQPKMAQQRDSMSPGGRVAIKSMRGKGAKTITIKGLGVVKEVADKRVYINWLIKNMDREAPVRGCLAAIHGPYDVSGDDSEWVREVFCL